jgi:hypothetical protein
MTFAFPSGHNPQRGRQEDGMTLRDYFATRAMLNFIDVDDDDETLEMLAKKSYQMADMMLKVRDEL